MRTLRALLLRTAILLATMSLAACGASGSTGGASATAAPSHAANKVTVTAGDTSLCNVISVSEFSQAVGGGVATLKTSSTQLPSGVVMVGCAYLPPSMPGPGGAIDFAIASNGPAYYAEVKQEEQGSLNSVNTLSGVGDAAFWGTDSTAQDILNLDMLKDNVVVGITMDGSAKDGSTYLPGAEQIAKELASKL